MAQIRIDLAETLVDGMDIKFKAPCACNEITGLIVYYPVENDTTQTKEFTFRDSHGNDLTGIGNLFSKDAYVKVVADAVNGYAYIQNADTNGYLNSAIFGTYTHDAENLIGSGENGKFKATVSGTISSINVNGVSCSVRCGEDTTMDLIAGCWYTFILDGNTVNFSSGGAGGGLNFKVVGGTTEPVSPKENMIWVNTDKEITSYAFAAVEPSDPAEGMVWITIGTSSTVEFNALKKNGIQVYPISAKQYVSGAWVDVTAKSYQGGEWVDWIVKLFVPGMTPEITALGWKAYSSQTARAPTVSVGADVITVSQPHASGGYTGVAYFEKRDLSAASKITMVYTLSHVIDEGDESTGLFVWSEVNSGYYIANSAAFSSVPDDTTSGTLTVDVKALSGEYYIGVGIRGASSYTPTLKISELTIE